MTRTSKITGICGKWIGDKIGIYNNITNRKYFKIHNPNQGVEEGGGTSTKNKLFLLVNKRSQRTENALDGKMGNKFLKIGLNTQKKYAMLNYTWRNYKKL